MGLFGGAHLGRLFLLDLQCEVGGFLGVGYFLIGQLQQNLRKKKSRMGKGSRCAGFSQMAEKHYQVHYKACRMPRKRQLCAGARSIYEWGSPNDEAKYEAWQRRSRSGSRQSPGNAVIGWCCKFLRKISSLVAVWGDLFLRHFVGIRCLGSAQDAACSKC